MQEQEETSERQTSSRAVLASGEGRKSASLRLAPLHRLGAPLATPVPPRVSLLERQDAPLGSSPAARTAATRSREYLAAARGRGRGSDRSAYLRSAASWRASDRQRGKNENKTDQNIHIESTDEKTCALGAKLEEVVTEATKGLQAAVVFFFALWRDVPARITLHFITQFTCLLVTLAIIGFVFVNAISIAPKEGDEARPSELCPEGSEAVYNYSRTMSFAAIFFAGAILNFKEFLSIPVF